MNQLDKRSIFIIGAQKCGTTAIHDLLLSHPELSLPNIKETHYFSNESLYKKGLKWYLKHFDLNKKYMCEVDPSYLFFPGTAKRIKDSMLDSKFIVIFRKPIDRAFSQYLMSCYRGYEKFPFLDALDMEEERLKNKNNHSSFVNHSYLSRGYYVDQLNSYLSIFNREDFLFIKFDDLISSKKNKVLLKSICSFIGVDSTLIKHELPKSNSKKKIKSDMIRDLLYKDTKLKRVAQLAIPSDELRNRIKNIINSFNSISYDKSYKSKEAIDTQLESLPKEYIDWNNQQSKLLSQITDLNLDDWMYI